MRTSRNRYLGICLPYLCRSSLNASAAFEDPFGAICLVVDTYKGQEDFSDYEQAESEQGASEAILTGVEGATKMR